MGLICSEKGKVLSPPDKLYAVSHPLGPGYAVGGVVDRIPEPARQRSRLRDMDEGLNVFLGITTVNPTFRTYSFSEFRTGRFLFSVSPSTAKRYLPKTFRRILADIRREAH